MKHGLTGYKKHRCRCFECCDANTAAQRRWRDKRGGGKVYVGPRSIGREGLVTAFDSDGRYVGCIGSETWVWLIAEGHNADTLIRSEVTFAGALRFICTSNDSGPWLDVYRGAQGGYEGLQAVARAALDAGRRLP